MKNKISLTIFALLTFFTIAKAEARPYFNFGFGINVSQPRYAYVENYHYPHQEQIIIRQDPWGRIISQERVIVAPAPITRTVYPVYQRQVRPTPVFSFDFFH